MEKSSKLDDDTKTYCNVLASCSLAEVANWKDEDLERVFRWANYFKQVYSKCSLRQKLMDKFDKRFREIGCHGGWRFGGELLSCEFLGHSQQYLTKALLENPALSLELREKVLRKYEEIDGKEAKEDMMKHINELDNSRALLATLEAIHIKVRQHAQTYHPNCTPQIGVVSVEAEYLLEEIHWLLSLRQGEKEPAAISPSQTILHKKLHLLTFDTKGGMEILLQSLLTAPGNTEATKGHMLLVPGSPKEMDKERIVVLEWIFKQLKNKDGMESSSTKLNKFQLKMLLECSPKLLTSISTIYSAFFTEYVQLLMTRVEEIEQRSVQSITKLSTREPGTDSMARDNVTGTYTNAKKETEKGRLSIQEPGTNSMESGNITGGIEKGSADFDLLVEHFKTLTQSSKHAKEVCVSLLKSKIHPSISEKYSLPPMVGTIWNRLLHAVSVLDQKV